MARPAPPAPRLDSPPLLDLAEESCPNCKAALAPDALVCMACGYDLKQNRIITPETGSVEAPEPAPAPDARPEFVRRGGTTRVVAVLGLVALIAAAVCAWLNAPRGATFFVSASMSILAVYNAILHTGTGLAAVWLTARWKSEQMTRFDLAAARVLLAFSVYLIVVSLPIHMEMKWLEVTLKFLAGFGAYYLMLWALFRRDRVTTAILLAFHVAMWLFVEFGIQIAAGLKSAIDAAPKIGT